LLQSVPLSAKKCQIADQTTDRGWGEKANRARQAGADIAE